MDIQKTRQNKVITVRMTTEDHFNLSTECDFYGVSLNELCLQKLKKTCQIEKPKGKPRGRKVLGGKMISTKNLTESSSVG